MRRPSACSAYSAFAFTSCVLLALASAPACSSRSTSIAAEARGATSASNEAGAPLPIGAAGGTATSADGVVILEIPAGALAATTTLSAVPTTSPGAGAVGQVYDLEPSGTTFATPITIAFELTGAILDAGDASNLTIATYANGAWSAVDSVLVDDTAITARISHFSPWALVAKSGATSTTTGTTTCGNDVVCAGGEGASTVGVTCSFENDAGEPIFCTCNGKTYECSTATDAGTDADADAAVLCAEGASCNGADACAGAGNLSCKCVGTTFSCGT